MKKFLFSLTLCFLLFVSIQAQSPLKNNDSIITATLAFIDPDSVRSHIQALQDMGTRFMIAPNRKSIALWIKNKFHSYGISDVRIDSCTCHVSISYGNLQFDTTTWQYNVIATIPGSLQTNNTSIICAHYDDAVIYGAPLVYAPGADDNATGVAALFETARALQLANYTPKRNIELIAFGAEELINFGTSGSMCYANQAFANGKQIEMVINNDAMGFYNGDWTVTIYGLTGFTELPDLMSQMRAQFTTLAEYKQILTSLQGTDCQPFFQKGYSTVFICEHADNTSIHSIGDTIGRVDMNYCKEIIKMSCAAVMHSDMLVVGVDSDTKPNYHFSVYPNPVMDVLYFKTDKNFQPTSFKILDLQGKIVNQGIIPNNYNSIDTKNLVKGFYILQLFNPNEMMVSKFVKE